MKLLRALQVAPGDMVAFVGGGGKTTAMFRLAREIVEGGGRVVTTTTTRIFAAQTRLAPVHVQSIPDLLTAIERHPHVLITGEVDALQGKAFGLDPHEICNLKSQLPDCTILIEADGSRMRPFKAPAEHEPVIPDCATVVVVVAGAEVIGKPLTDEFVHRSELVARLYPGQTVTAEMVAAVLASPLGGRKSVPVGAKVVALINKADTAERVAAANEVAGLLRESGVFDGVVLSAVNAASEPVVWVGPIR